MRLQKVALSAAGALCMFAGAAHGQITPIGPFNGPFTETFDDGPQTIFLPCIPQRIFNNFADMCTPGASGTHTTSGWSFMCTIFPHNGSRFYGSAGGFTRITFDAPVSQFGGYFGTNCGTDGGQITFYDANMNVIGMTTATTAGCTWTWNGWQSSLPFKYVDLASNAFGGAFLDMDDLEYSFGTQPTGACCLPSGSCLVTTQGGCTSLGGTYRGDNSPCSTANCPQPPTGACCLPNLTCIITYQQGCTSQGGTYHGDNSACATAGCPQAWQEQGDAGDLPGTAQIPQGSGPLPGIVGNLDAGDVDMYQIQICDPSTFQATLVGGATFDSMLWLFDSTGAGLSCDDDSQGTLQSTISNVNVPGTGLYYIAVSGYFNQPEDASGQGLWSSYGQDTRPNGPGAGNPVAEWSGGGASGSYTMFLNGACYPGGGGSTCYANCDHSTQIPFLNVNDFICFQGKFAAGDTYANCDMSTQPPVLNVNDFICFQGKFAAGCSAP